jgi:thymidylate synthase ThyX
MENGDAHQADTAVGTEVYAIHGADPEVLAYAMAKYSRSALSLKESLREISAQRAEQFLNTFYFQYGHRSIADLAHLAFAVERLSLLAAIVLVDEQRWDGQERSTRYQDFEKSGWYTPAFSGSSAGEIYTSGIRDLLTSYREVSDGVFAELRATTDRPPEMKPEAFDRTLRARAFDVARYLLPLAANTSLGQIVNARTLETQVSRLLSHPLAEVRALGEALRDAAAGEAWMPQAEPGARPVRVAPTLVKYAVPNRYLIETRTLLAEAATALMHGAVIADAPVVDLVEDSDTLEVDLAASLLYSASHYPFRQLRDHVAALPEARRDEIIDLGLRERGRHDELLREFAAGQRLRFDLLMDIGGFRDMHRHRRCTQLLQGFTGVHGWETPAGLGAQESAFTAAMEAAAAARAALPPDARADGADQYLLPLATRTRALFRMDFAEALYIAELRSAPQGHLSYRRVAWEMYQAVARRHPALARHFRVTDVNAPLDLLKR